MTYKYKFAVNVSMNPKSILNILNITDAPDWHRDPVNIHSVDGGYKDDKAERGTTDYS